MPNVPVAVSGVANSEPSRTTSDGNGHYAFPSMRMDSGSGAWVFSIGVPGYVSGVYPVPVLGTSGQTARIDMHMDCRFRPAASRRRSPYDWA